MTLKRFATIEEVRTSDMTDVTTIYIEESGLIYRCNLSNSLEDDGETIIVNTPSGDRWVEAQQFDEVSAYTLPSDQSVITDIPWPVGELKELTFSTGMTTAVTFEGSAVTGDEYTLVVDNSAVNEQKTITLVGNYLWKNTGKAIKSFKINAKAVIVMKFIAVGTSRLVYYNN